MDENKHAWRGLTQASLMTIALLLASTPWRAVVAQGTVKVEERPNTVQLNGSMEDKKPQATDPGRTLPANNGYTIISKNFEPPTDMHRFEEFPNQLPRLRRKTHVDILSDPDGAGGIRLKDGPKRIQVGKTFIQQGTAVDFPLQAEGNMSKKGEEAGTAVLQHWAAKVSGLEVDLVIHNGQFGPPVPEDKEESVGAFTVANMNDTDQDGGIRNQRDKDDMTVDNEVDLMKLILKKPDPDLGGSVELEIVKGNIKLWENSFKQTLVTDRSFPTSILDKTIWIEALETSGSLRSIELKLTYKGVEDIVTATGIWADLDAVEHDIKTAAVVLASAPWSRMTTPPRNVVSIFGGTGLRPIVQRVLGGKVGQPNLSSVIIFQWTLLPRAVVSVPRVRFDLTRQKETIKFEITGPNVKLVDQENFPSQVEKANDDAGDSDESVTPTSSGEMYGSDAPGLLLPVNLDATKIPDRIVVRSNFNEFVRVKFDNTRPTGNTLEGSRCSDIFAWHERKRLNKNQTTIKTSQGPLVVFTVLRPSDTMETNTNDIGPQHITIGTTP